ncbi:MAG: hypothetical protein Q8807_00380, partial ['Waltheria sp.' little leaf phytoplasma]|nr:hypothetical protein ['Waltheria sp.' little leaf phytoplasma]
MASRMLGNLPVRFRWGLFCNKYQKVNPDKKTQIIYPYHEQSEYSNNDGDNEDDLKDISSNSILSGSGSLHEPSVNSPTFSDSNEKTTIWSQAQNAINFFSNNADQLKDLTETTKDIIDTFQGSVTPTSDPLVNEKKRPVTPTSDPLVNEKKRPVTPTSDPLVNEKKRPVTPTSDPLVNE